MKNDMFNNTTMTKEQLEEICLETVREQLLDYDRVKEEMQLLRDGYAVMVPHDVEHARAMFKVACFYLTEHDKEFSLNVKL